MMLIIVNLLYYITYGGRYRRIWCTLVYCWAPNSCMLSIQYL